MIKLIMDSKCDFTDFQNKFCNLCCCHVNIEWRNHQLTFLLNLLYEYITSIIIDVCIEVIYHVNLNYVTNNPASNWAKTTENKVKRIVIFQIG